MNCENVVKAIERELKKRQIPKGRFYEESGITSSVLSNWRKGINQPSAEQLKKVEDYLGLKFEFSEVGANHDSVKFALFGTDEITDELYQEVLRFAKYAHEQERFRNFNQRKEQ